MLLMEKAAVSQLWLSRKKIVNVDCAISCLAGRNGNVTALPPAVICQNVVATELCRVDNDIVMSYMLHKAGIVNVVFFMSGRRKSAAVFYVVQLLMRQR